ncbi:hypothetical protein [Streptomyces sp. NBC_01304]|uniref:hypothetical protein n=1 Tax=Streptomyces sp. NBC_01304 TaxID=2903818 RepID=UPI002E0F4179|nr:hypothetical protein OG430_41975 [Streptomyces sp. NBC_01304]
MRLDSIPVWVIAVVAVICTVILLSMLITAMPNKGQKVQVCVAPILAFVFAMASGSMKGWSTQVSLSYFSCAMAAFTLGIAGHRKEIYENAKDQAVHGVRKGNKGSTWITVQVIASLAVLFGLCFYLFEDF